MDKIFFTYKIPDEGLLLLKGYDIMINTEDRFLSKKRLFRKPRMR